MNSGMVREWQKGVKLGLEGKAVICGCERLVPTQSTRGHKRGDSLRLPEMAGAAVKYFVHIRSKMTNEKSEMPFVQEDINGWRY